MRPLAAPLLLAFLVAGCGGGTGTGTDSGTLSPGYYSVSARVLRSNAAASDYTGRVSVANDGTVRLFGVDQGGSEVTLSRLPGQVNSNGTNATAVLNGAASTGDLSTLVDNLISFNGLAFTLTANGSAISLPSVGTSRTLSPGTYRGELIRVGLDGAVTDWGSASALLATSTTTTPATTTIQATLNPTTVANSNVSATLASDGTAASVVAASGAWSSDGAGLILSLTGGSQGSGTLFLVLNRQGTTP